MRKGTDSRAMPAGGESFAAGAGEAAGASLHRGGAAEASAAAGALSSSAAPPSLLRVTALTAGWPGAHRPVCGPLSFALAPGEILGIGGANGAGKSTLLAAIAGSARLFAGSVERRPGLRLAHQRQLPPAFAGVPFNGHDLLALTGASSAGLPPWLASRLALRLDTLSGGQRQFLHLWASLQAPADLVMLDEPTNNLDPAGVAALEVALRRRAADGVGLLLVSHDAAFIAAVCDRVLRLDAPAGAGDDSDPGDDGEADKQTGKHFGSDSADEIAAPAGDVGVPTEARQ